MGCMTDKMPESMFKVEYVKEMLPGMERWFDPDQMDINIGGYGYLGIVPVEESTDARHRARVVRDGGGHLHVTLPEYGYHLAWGGTRFGEVVYSINGEATLNEDRRQYLISDLPGGTTRWISENDFLVDSDRICWVDSRVVASPDSIEGRIRISRENGALQAGIPSGLTFSSNFKKYDREYIQVDDVVVI